MDIVKKVTIAGAKLAAVNAANGRLYMGRLLGVATGTKTGTSQYGEWTALIGDFCRISPEGEHTRAPQAFAPDMVMFPIVAQLNSAGGSVDVAVDVYACVDTNSPCGFSYRAQPVIPETQENSPLARLMAAASPMPALAAPKAGKKA